MYIFRIGDELKLRKPTCMCLFLEVKSIQTISLILAVPHPRSEWDYCLVAFHVQRFDKIATDAVIYLVIVWLMQPRKPIADESHV